MLIPPSQPSQHSYSLQKNSTHPLQGMLRRNGTRALAMVASLVVLSSCAQREGFQSAYPEEEIEHGLHRIETPQEVAEALGERTTDYQHLWMKADVVIRQLEEEERDFFTATAMYQEPDSIRLRGTRTPIGTIFDVLILGENAWLHFPREGQVFEGPLSQLTEKFGALSGLGPEQLVSAVMVNQQLTQWMDEGTPYQVKPADENHLLVVAREPDTLRQYFWLVRRDDGLVKELLVRSHRGVEELRIRYMEYRLEKNTETGVEEPFPEEFEIEVARHQALVEVDMSEYRLGEELPERAWEHPSAREVYPMSSLRFEENP